MTFSPSKRPLRKLMRFGFPPSGPKYSFMPKSVHISTYLPRKFLFFFITLTIGFCCKDKKISNKKLKILAFTKKNKYHDCIVRLSLCAKILLSLDGYAYVLWSTPIKNICSTYGIS